MAVEVLKSRYTSGAASLRAAGGLPLALVIDDRAHHVTSLAEDGGAIVDYDGHAEPGQILQTTMLVDFNGFEVTVPALWEVISSVRERHQLYLRLAPVNDANHLATITTILQALRNGETLDAGDLVDVARTNEAGRVNAYEAAPEPAGHRWRMRTGTVLFTLLALVLIGFIATNLGVRAFVVEADGVVVSPQPTTLLMPGDGQLVSYAAKPGARVATGAPLATVRSSDGQLLTVTSTCDCTVGKRIVADQAALRQGQPIVQLTPADGTSRVLLSLPLRDMRRVRVGDKISANFYDAEGALSGRIERVMTPRVGPAGMVERTNYSGTVEVRLAQKVPGWRVGEPLSARVVLSRLNPFS